MFFIFGWGHPIRKTYGPTKEKECPRCHNTRFWILEKVSLWFTLFFIPIIPTSTKRTESCPICGYNREVLEDEFEELKAMAEMNEGVLKEEGLSSK